MILEPEQDKEKPSAVRSFTPEVEEEEETGAGKTETEAPESTRKRWEESLSLRYTREELIEPVGKEKASSYRPLSFPTRNKETALAGIPSSYRSSSDQQITETCRHT